MTPIAQFGAVSAQVSARKDALARTPKFRADTIGFKADPAVRARHNDTISIGRQPVADKKHVAAPRADVTKPTVIDEATFIKSMSYHGYDAEQAKAMYHQYIASNTNTGPNAGPGADISGDVVPQTPPVCKDGSCVHGADADQADGAGNADAGSAGNATDGIVSKQNLDAEMAKKAEAFMKRVLGFHGYDQEQAMAVFHELYSSGKIAFDGKEFAVRG